MSSQEQKWMESLEEFVEINAKFEVLVGKIPFISLKEINDGLADAAVKLSYLLEKSMGRELVLEKELEAIKEKLAEKTAEYDKLFI